MTSLELRLASLAMEALHGRWPRKPMPSLRRCPECRDLMDPCEACLAAYDEEGDRRRKEAQEDDRR